MQLRAAPPLSITQWFNAPAPLSLEALRGKVVVIEAFQMLCPGCVSHGLPQAQRIADAFRKDDVAVLGLHTVFEHHDAMGPKALEAFLHEYRIRFPVGVDEPSGRGIPKTMAAYGMQGTPTLILVDRRGFVRKHKFGQESDLVLGAEIMALVLENAAADIAPAPGGAAAGSCDDDACKA